MQAANRTWGCGTSRHTQKWPAAQPLGWCPSWTTLPVGLPGRGWTGKVIAHGGVLQRVSLQNTQAAIWDRWLLHLSDISDWLWIDNTFYASSDGYILLSSHFIYLWLPPHPIHEGRSKSLLTHFPRKQEPQGFLKTEATQDKNKKIYLEDIFQIHSL